MFKNQQINEKEIETIIGPLVKVKGDFQTDGSMQIDGHLEGTLKIGNDLIVGEKAVIIANLQAKRIMVAGEVIGNIKAKESLEITETAKINGDINAQILSVDPGAQINGRIKMAEKAQVPKNENPEKQTNEKNKIAQK